MWYSNKINLLVVVCTFINWYFGRCQSKNFKSAWLYNGFDVERSCYNSWCPQRPNRFNIFSIVFTSCLLPFSVSSGLFGCDPSLLKKGFIYKDLLYLSICWTNGPMAKLSSFLAYIKLGVVDVLGNSICNLNWFFGNAASANDSPS